MWVGVTSGEAETPSLIGELSCVGVGVCVGVGWSVLVAMGECIAIWVGFGVRRDATPASLGLALPQTYDETAQHAQTKQYTNKMPA